MFFSGSAVEFVVRDTTVAICSRLGAFGRRPPARDRDLSEASSGRRRPRTGNLPSTAVRGFSTTKISPSHHTCPGRRPRPLAHRLAPHVVSPISPHSSTRRSTGASRVRTRNDHRVSRSRRKLGVPCRSRLSRLSCRSSSRPDFPRAAATRHPHATRAGSRELERQTKQRRPFFGRRSEGFASRGAFGGHGVGRDAGTSHAPHPPPCSR